MSGELNTGRRKKIRKNIRQRIRTWPEDVRVIFGNAQRNSSNADIFKSSPRCQTTDAAHHEDWPCPWLLWQCPNMADQVSPWAYQLLLLHLVPEAQQSVRQTSRFRICKTLVCVCELFCKQCNYYDLPQLEWQAPLLQEGVGSGACRQKPAWIVQHLCIDNTGSLTILNCANECFHPGTLIYLKGP